MLCAQSGSPAMYADFANQSYEANVSGMLTSEPLSTVATSVGATGAFYIDSTGHGQTSVAGSPRMTFDTISGAPDGIYVEPASSNLITTAATFTSDSTCTFRAGANSQAAVTTEFPALFPGYAVVEMLRDSFGDGAVPNFVCPITNTATVKTFVMSAWVYVPGVALANFSSATYPSTASAICIQSSGTGVSNSKQCFDLNKKDVWQKVSMPIATTATTSTATLVVGMLGPPGAIAFTTAWQVTAGPLESSLSASTGKTAESLVATGVGLGQIGSGSGTLVYKGFFVNASNIAGAASGGLQASDGTVSNAIALQVSGDPVNPTLQAVVNAAGTTIAAISGSAVQPGQYFTAALSWGTSGYVYADSLGGIGSATGAVPTGLSHLAALPGPNPHSLWAFYPTAMTASTLQSLVGTGLSVTASANTSIPGLTIPLDFVGFSFEMGAFGNHQFAVAGGDAASGTSMEAMMKLLGHGVVRLGGNTSDNGTTLITSANATELGTFAPLVPNWIFIVGLDNCANDPTSQATAAGYLATAVPGIILQFGNEPDIYTSTGCSVKAPPANEYGPSSFITDWNTMFTDVRTVAPSVAVAGPDIGSLDSWIPPFLTAEASNISLLTRHYYAVCPNGTFATTPNLLMTDVPTGYPARTLPQDVALATAHSLKLRMTETNSVCAGGQPNVSNTSVAAVWALDYMMQGAAAGLAGVNYHGDSASRPPTGSPQSAYTPIVQATDLTWTFTPLGYAMLTFAQIEGMRLLPVTSSVPFSTMPVQAYLDSSGNVWFLAVNKNQAQPAQLTLNQPGSTQVSILLMTSPSPTATTETLGGATADNAGHWTPTPIVQASSAPIEIPPDSAALVKLQ